MSPVFYEVSASVRDDLRPRYESYLRERHIREVLATGCFLGARLERATSGSFRVRYEAASRESVDRYLETHAARLRADVLAHFPDGIEWQRECWSALESFSAGADTAPPARTSRP
jgi:hypothetical protein